MAGFQPDEGFKKVVQLLQATQNPEFQIRATAKVQELRSSVAFQNSVMAVLLHGGRHNVPEHIRQSAGLIMKNHMRRYSPEQRTTVKRLSLALLADSNRIVRNVAGTLIAYIARLEGIKQWPELTPTLLRYLNNTNQEGQIGAAGSLQALLKVVEDTGDAFMTENNGDNNGTDEQVLKVVLIYLQHPLPQFKVYTLRLLGCLLYQQSRCFDLHINQIIATLAKLCSHPNVEVQQELVEVFIVIVDIYAKYSVLQDGNAFESICRYMLQSTIHKHEPISRASIRFWTEAAWIEDRRIRGIILRFLPNLLPILVQKCQIKDDDPKLIDADDDWTVADESKDIVPRSYAKGYYMAGTTNGEDEEEDNQHNNYYDDDPEEDFTIRKVAGRAIESIAGSFQGVILPMILPSISQALSAQGDKNWRLVESGLVSLGAIIQFCIVPLSKHLPKLVSWIHRNLSNKISLVINTSCWVMGQFRKWFVDQALEGNEQTLKLVISSMIKLMLHPKKGVQQSAMSCLAFLIEDSRHFFAPFVKQTLQNLLQGFLKYQKKSILMSIDVIRSLVESFELEPIVRTQEVATFILKLILGKWSQIKQIDDRMHLCFLDNIFIILPQLHQPTVRTAIPALAKRVVSMFMTFASQLITTLEGAHNQRIIKHAMDDTFEFLTNSIFLIDAIADILKKEFSKLNLDKRLVPAMVKVANTKCASINNGIFTLFGDMSQYCFNSIVEPHTAIICAVLCQNIVPEFCEMSSNGIWAYTEIARRAPISTIAPSVQPMIEMVKKVLWFWRLHPDDHHRRNLLHNCIILVNVMASKAPQVLAATFSRDADGHFFLWQWLMRLAREVPSRNIQHKQMGTLCVVKIMQSAPAPFIKPTGNTLKEPQFRNSVALFDLMHSWVDFMQKSPKKVSPTLHAAIQQSLVFVKQKYTQTGLWVPFLAELNRHNKNIVTKLHLS